MIFHLYRKSTFFGEKRLGPHGSMLFIYIKCLSDTSYPPHHHHWCISINQIYFLSILLSMHIDDKWTTEYIYLHLAYAYIYFFLIFNFVFVGLGSIIIIIVVVSLSSLSITCQYNKHNQQVWLTNLLRMNG